MQIFWKSYLCGLLTVFTFCFLKADLIEAKALYVSNYGIDSSSCGTLNNPGRSISQVIANASANDRIIVGPGRYGDLNGDGDFSEMGEEAAEIGSGCFCMIKIDKSLSLESSDGQEREVWF
jgi:hypothetical protein